MALSKEELIGIQHREISRIQTLVSQVEHEMRQALGDIEGAESDPRDWNDLTRDWADRLKSVL